MFGTYAQHSNFYWKRMYCVNGSRWLRLHRQRCQQRRSPTTRSSLFNGINACEVVQWDDTLLWLITWDVEISLWLSLAKLVKTASKSRGSAPSMIDHSRPFFQPSLWTALAPSPFHTSLRPAIPFRLNNQISRWCLLAMARGRAVRPSRTKRGWQSTHP